MNGSANGKRAQHRWGDALDINHDDSSSVTQVSITTWGTKFWINIQNFEL
jgi:hypothetical protein